ncbi:MAG TPA: hypothetical protein VMG82_07415 [Candidatus Sulfotelmatobacter sp.]|nr:hypothetical protein [Candidatus Sulfotelmatobacter sp.]
MASSTDRSEDALPRPELNPLLNPLLADNMGRWAEVYFTNPPEKREEAVLDLIRQLQAQKSEQNVPAAAPEAAAVIEPDRRVQQFRRTTTERRSDLRPCETCGHDNPLSNQFCGMCGAKVGPAASGHFRSEEFYDTQQRGNQGVENRDYAESHDEYRESIAEEVAARPQTSAKDPYDLELFQRLRAKNAADKFEYEQSPGVRYRYYIGAILAALIVLLAYMAWHGAQSNQNVQGTSPPPGPTDTTARPTNQNTAASTPANAPTATASQAGPETRNAASSAGSRPVETPDHGTTAAANRQDLPNPVSATPDSDNLTIQGSQGSGGEEFAAAQKYLNGTNGQARDGAEAARWLWKAMAKNNGPAMVALADLYLKGDGVSKNCDQARVLLDSAALRGVAGAGQRLRDLQAFGCQ